MTISTTTSRQSYNGNGVTTVFSVPFRFFANTDLVVQLVTASTGASTTLTLTTHYTVTGADEEDGGSLTMLTAPAVGERLVIRRVIGATQEVDYVAGDPFPAETHERALDRLTMLAQQFDEVIDRSLVFPSGDTASGELPAVATRANKLLGFNSSGGLVVSAPASGSAAELALSLASTAAGDGAEMVGFIQSGTGAVAQTQQEKNEESVSALDFMTDAQRVDVLSRTGTLDVSAAIAAAYAAHNRVELPDGVMRLTSALDFSGDKQVLGAGRGLSVFKPDIGLLEPITFGAASLFTGRAENITIERASFNGASENKGFVYKDVSDGLFINLESRLSKYNHYFAPEDGKRVAYSQWVNASGVGGLYNIAGVLTGTGYANENTFNGGRMFTTADTDAQVYLDFSTNHWRFNDMSCEGAGQQAFYINGTALINSHSNHINNCRTEGTWVVDDVVLGADTQRNIVTAVNLYTTVTDLGISNTLLLANDSKISAAENLKTALTAKRNGLSSSTVPAFRVHDAYTSSGDGFGIEVRSGRDTATGYIIKGVRNSDDLIRFSVSSNGNLFAGISVAAGQSAWNFSPLKLGAYVLWVDSTGRLRIKNGTPASETDGTIVGTQT